MFKLYRGRSVNVGERYKAYRNLNNSMFSLIAMNGEFKGKVVAHADSVTLMDVQFSVSQASRERACRERTRNVHAFAVGTLSSLSYCEIQTVLHEPITYHPFTMKSFVVVATQQPITITDNVLLQHGKAYLQTLVSRRLHDLLSM
jgi:hypothetical protein